MKETGKRRVGEREKQRGNQCTMGNSQREEETKGVSLPRGPGRLWAPWRAEYIFAEKSGGCILCEASSGNDKECLVLHRETRAFVIMNKFPYNNGHLMVVPCRHVGDIQELTEQESRSLWELVQRSVRVLKMKMKPQGFNVGMNLGRIAGAGVEDHLHIHVVPRWSGDVNFMPVITGTKVISQSLEEAYHLLKEGFVETERTNTRKEIEY